MGRFGTRTDAPQRGSVEASNLHGATSADMAVLPKRSDSPKGTRQPAYREATYAYRRPRVSGGVAARRAAKEAPVDVVKVSGWLKLGEGSPPHGDIGHPESEGLRESLGAGRRNVASVGGLLVRHDWAVTDRSPGPS